MQPMASQAMQMLLKYIMSKKYFRQGRELESGSVWGGPIISLDLSQGAPKSHNLVLNITVVISDGIDLTQRLFQHLYCFQIHALLYQNDSSLVCIFIFLWQWRKKWHSSSISFLHLINTVSSFGIAI